MSVKVLIARIVFDCKPDAFFQPCEFKPTHKLPQSAIGHALAILAICLRAIEADSLTTEVFSNVTSELCNRVL